MNVLVTAAANSPSIADFVPLMFFFGIFYFLMIRPQRVKAKKHQEKVNSLMKGTSVILSSGIHGEIDSVEDGFFNVKIADKVIVKVEQGGIQAILGDDASAKPVEAKA